MNNTTTNAGSSVMPSWKTNVRAGTSAFRGPLRPRTRARYCAIPGVRQALRERRQRDAPVFFRQRRHQTRLDLGQDDDVADVQRGQHDSRKERAGIQLHHRYACRRAVDDQQHRRRNQNTQTSASGDGAGTDLDVVAGLQHCRKSKQPHQRHDRADDAGRGRKYRARDNRCHRERAGHARHRQMQASKQLFDQIRALDQVTHENEQRNRDQHIVGHHRVRALNHQIKDLIREQDPG